MAGVKEVAAKVAQKTGVTLKAANEAVAAFVESIEEITASGESAVFKGFGVFKVKTTKATVRKNPQTGKEIQVPSKKKLTFKASPAK